MDWSSSSVPFRAGAHVGRMDDSLPSVLLTALLSTPSHSDWNEHLLHYWPPNASQSPCPQSISEMELSLCTRKKSASRFGGLWLFKSKYSQPEGLKTTVGSVLFGLNGIWAATFSVSCLNSTGKVSQRSDVLSSLKSVLEVAFLASRSRRCWETQIKHSRASPKWNIGFQGWISVFLNYQILV